MEDWQSFEDVAEKRKIFRIDNHDLQPFEHMDLEEIMEKPLDTVVSRQGDVDITVQDLKRLQDKTKYLNEDIIAAYLKCLIQDSRFRSTTVLPFLSIQVVNKTASALAGGRVGRQLKQEVHKDGLVLIPVNNAKHWTLITIDGQSRTMQYFDSKHNPVLPQVRVIKELFEILFDTKFDLSVRVDIPYQENNVDCGVYVCKFAEHILTGIDLDFDDSKMSDFRMEISARIRKLPREIMSSQPRIQVDQHIQMKEDSMEVDVLSEPEGEQEAKSDLIFLPSFRRLQFDSIERRGVYSYEESMKAISDGIDEPFMGKTKEGREITYNIQEGDWKSMLSITEILNYFSPGSPKEGWIRMEKEVETDPFFPQTWTQNVCTPGKPTPFNFRYHSIGYFKKIKSMLRKYHGIELHSSHDAENKKKAKRYFLKNKLKKKQKKGTNPFR